MRGMSTCRGDVAVGRFIPEQSGTRGVDVSMSWAGRRDRHCVDGGRRGDGRAEFRPLVWAAWVLLRLRCRRLRAVLRIR